MTNVAPQSDTWTSIELLLRLLILNQKLLLQCFLGVLLEQDAAIDDFLGEAVRNMRIVGKMAIVFLCFEHISDVQSEARLIIGLLLHWLQIQIVQISLVKFGHLRV